MTRSALAVLLLLAGCAQPGGGSGGSGGDQLLGRTFLSTGVTGHELVSGTRITLIFPEKGKISADAGCNHLFGELAFDGDRMAVSDMGGTDMGCDKPRHAQDEWLTKFLGAKPKWSLTGDELVLTGSGQEIKLTDRKVANPDKALLGTKWVVTTLIDGEVASSVPAGSEAFVQFEGERMTGNAGCNQMGAKVVHSAGKVVVSDIVTTKMACEDSRGALEKSVLAALTGELKVKIDADRLELKNTNGKGLQLTASS